MSEQSTRSEQPKEREGAQRSNKILWIAIGALLLVGLIALALARKLGQPLTQATTPPPPSGNSLVASPKLPTATAPPITSKITPAPKPAQPQPAQPQAPADVVAYLANLKKIELYRQQMQDNVEKELANQIANSAGMKDILMSLANGDLSVLDKQPTQGQQTMQATAKLWTRFAAWFNSLKPPQECQPLHDAYQGALVSVIASISDINEKLSSGDYAGLLADQGKSGAIDQKFSQAESQLNKIRNKYNLPDDFDIQSESGGSSLVGL